MTWSPSAERRPDPGPRIKGSSERQENAKNIKKVLTVGKKSDNINPAVASVAHLVERHLAKVEVASSSLVTRSKKRKTRLLMVPIGTFSEPGELSGTEADGGSRPPLCFHASNRMIASFSVSSFYHVRCVVALPHGRIQCADVPVHDPDALTSGTGVFLRPLPPISMRWMNNRSS